MTFFAADASASSLGGFSFILRLDGLSDLAAKRDERQRAVAASPIRSAASGLHRSRKALILRRCIMPRLEQTFSDFNNLIQTTNLGVGRSNRSGCTIFSFL